MTTNGPVPATAAREAGCCFYALPDALEPDQIDELIRPAVFTINASGWVWTGESCQGHPDAIKPTGWTHNTKPMLRLITRAEDFGTMLRLLCDSCYASLEEQDEAGVYHNAGLELWPQLPRPNGAWWLAPYREVLVYVPALVTFERNAALRVFERFAERVVEYGEALGSDPERPRIGDQVLQRAGDAAEQAGRYISDLRDGLGELPGEEPSIEAARAMAAQSALIEVHSAHIELRRLLRAES